MESDQVQKILNGDVLAAAKLIRDIENEISDISGMLRDLRLYAGKAFAVGITGVAGTGKSTILGRLVRYFRANRNMSVGVVAVDPTSPITGGAFLGDRLRIQGDGVDEGVFIRSLASRGWKGGLSKTAADIVLVMDAMGKDIIFVEAVGSGQADVDIAGISDTCICVLVPGMGDDIQFMKAGILEVADIFVINKADREGAGSLKALLEAVIDMKEQFPAGWKPPVVLTESTTDRGTDELGKTILSHKDYLTKSGELDKKRKTRNNLG
ncbi:MAG: methylmalonyl Co-A mutase-associated GTPase MeaB [Dehalococcoidales bacterium]|nr:MAG: methylmalonyl Co-A mutase-associated GTPase MeaB [Dehalococcoidales bacterium]